VIPAIELKHALPGVTGFPVGSSLLGKSGVIAKNEDVGAYRFVTACPERIMQPLYSWASRAMQSGQQMGSRT
jgi:hypothetical protein